jgi:competence protein ComEC
MFRVTVLAATAEPVLVIQDHGQVTLVNSGDANTARFTVLPFLQHQGINQVDWAIATNLQSTNSTGWLEIMQRLPVKTFYQHSNTPQNATRNPVIQNALQKYRGSYQPLNSGQMVPVGSTYVQLIDAEAPILQLQIHAQAWLLLGNLKPHELQKLALTQRLPRAQVLWWSGESLATDLLNRLEPEVAIASSVTLNPNTASALRQAKTKLFWTGRDGAIQWTPSGKFQTTIEATENQTSVL